MSLTMSYKNLDVDRERYLKEQRLFVYLCLNPHWQSNLPLGNPACMYISKGWTKYLCIWPRKKILHRSDNATKLAKKRFFAWCVTSYKHTVSKIALHYPCKYLELSNVYIDILNVETKDLQCTKKQWSLIWIRQRLQKGMYCWHEQPTLNK